jgi:hypothetical protein
MTRFYEKVVKVKADVAAILSFFSHSIRQIEVDAFEKAILRPVLLRRSPASYA